jgi:hypothetical protein
MRSAQQDYCYQQIHIDAARNATDDFNPFHDQKKWSRIHGNPFGMPIVLGFQRESTAPLCMPDADFSQLGNLDAAEDRSWIAQQRYFLKRKFMNAGHGKNFLAGSLVDQHYYFDEMEGRVQFPAMFPVALLSCALLEKAKQENYAFESNPVVYTSHLISVDRRVLQTLKSNDRLHLLVTVPETVPAGKGLGKKGFPQQLHRCFGLLSGNRILFRAEVVMAPLAAMLQDAAGT